MDYTELLYLYKNDKNVGDPFDSVLYCELLYIHTVCMVYIEAQCGVQ